VTVGRRSDPSTADPERGMILSHHTAPQYPDACHAYPAGDSLDAPVFSHDGNVHEALVDCHSANGVDHR